MLKSGLYSVIVRNEIADVLTIGNFTVVNTVDEAYDIVVGGDRYTLWNGYAQTNFGMTSIEIDVSNAPYGVVIFDAVSVDLGEVQVNDLNGGCQLEVNGYGRVMVHDEDSDVEYPVDEPIVLSIVREFDFETAE